MHWGYLVSKMPLMVCLRFGVWNLRLGIWDLDLDLEEGLDTSDEVIKEKVLRTFTRSYSELWHALFSSNPEISKVSSSNGASPTPPLPETTASSCVFRYPELVQLCFTNGALVTQWTRAMILLLEVKDTVTCHNILSTIVRLIIPLSSNPAGQLFLGVEMLKGVLGVLADGYQKSNHGEAIQVIILIYTTLRPLSNIPWETFSSLPGMQAEALKVRVFWAEREREREY